MTVTDEAMIKNTFSVCISSDTQIRERLYLWGFTMKLAHALNSASQFPVILQVALS